MRLSFLAVSAMMMPMRLISMVSRQMKTKIKMQRSSLMMKLIHFLRAQMTTMRMKLRSKRSRGLILFGPQ